MTQGRCFIGCAGWTLPRDIQHAFPSEGSHLQRYAALFSASEINSSFHRPHSIATYERWAASVPAQFRFSVKLPKTITHVAKLAGSQALLDEFFAQAAGLGDRLGCVLVQLPPSLAFDASLAASFFAALRERHAGAIALEPRHASWFTPDVDGWLAQRSVARVLADPVRHEGGRAPGGLADRIYLRLHGSPRMYYSAYDSEVIGALARRIAMALRAGHEVWCIFDNTAGNAAAHNAVELKQMLDKELR